MLGTKPRGFPRRIASFLVASGLLLAGIGPQTAPLAARAQEVPIRPAAAGAARPTSTTTPESSLRLPTRTRTPAVATPSATTTAANPTSPTVLASDTPTPRPGTASPSRTPTAVTTDTATPTVTATTVGATKTSTAPPLPTMKTSSRFAALPAPMGVSAYTGTNDKGTTYTLPLVRTDGSFDTVVHVVNATSLAEAVTITFHDQSGNVPSSGTITLPSVTAWATYDVDVDAQLGASFIGTALVTSSGGITVSADVYNGLQTSDNFDSYTALPTSSPATSGVIPLGINQGYVFSMYVQNPSTTQTLWASAYFWTDGQQKAAVSTSQAIAPQGMAILTGVSSSQWAIGPVQVFGCDPATTSNGACVSGISTLLPVLAVSDVSGSGGVGQPAIYSITPLVTASGTTAYVPRFVFDRAVQNWNSNLVMMNTGAPGSGAINFTATFLNPDGSTAFQTTNSAQPMRDFIIGDLPLVSSNILNLGTTSLPSGWVGSVLVTSNGPGAVITATMQLDVSTGQYVTALSTRPDPTTAPTGDWISVAALRKSASGMANASGTESTGLTLMNPSTTQQSFLVTFWPLGGGATAAEALTISNLQPNAAFSLDQAVDGTLAAGQEYSVQLTNVNAGGPLPVVVAELFGGTYTVPTPVTTFAPTFTSTPTPSGSPVNTTEGVSTYLGMSDSQTSFNLPLVRTTLGNDTVIHVVDTSGQANALTVTFRDASGSVTTSQTVNLAPYGSQDLDVVTISGLSTFNGSATVASNASQTFVVSVDVTGQANATLDNYDSYDGIPPSQAATSFALGGTNAYYHFYTTVDLQNPGPTPALASLTIQTTATTIATTTPVPANGVANVSLKAIKPTPPPNDWAGALQIASNVPLDGVSEVTGNGGFGIGPMAPAGTTYYVPRFEANPRGGWNGVAIMQNTGASAASATMTFYNPDGSLAVPTPVSVTINPGAVALEETFFQSTLGLSSGFTGTAVIQTSAPTVSVLIMKLWWYNYTFPALGTYAPPIAPPSGRVVTLPNLRNNAGGYSTAFTVMNPDSTPQTYEIDYYDSSGTQRATENQTIAAFGSVYLNQSTDSVTVGLNGIALSARISNKSGGDLPIALAELYQGGYAPTTPTPIPTATFTPTISPTVTPTASGPSPTPIPTDTFEPDETMAQAVAIPLDGSQRAMTIDPLGDLDWVKFTVDTSGGPQTVQLTTTGPTCDTTVTFFNPPPSPNPTITGTPSPIPIGGDDDGGSGFSSVASYTFTSSGTYYAMVRHFITTKGNASWINVPTFGSCAFQLQGALVPPGSTPSPTLTLVPLASVQPTTSATSTPTRNPALPTAVGIAAYTGSTNLGTSFNLPLVRSDSTHDTIIHIANANGVPIVATLTVYQQGGGVQASVPLALASWGQDDFDVGQQLGLGLLGAAVVSAPSGIAVSADVIDATVPSDNVDAYAGIPVGATSGWLQLVANNYSLYDSTLYLQNLSNSTATVSLTFYKAGVPSVASPVPAIPPHGQVSIDAGTLTGISSFVQPVLVQSNVPVAVVSELVGPTGAANAADGIETMQGTSGGAATYFVPRVDWSGSLAGPNTGIAILNAAGTSQDFTITFYNPDGTQAAVMTPAAVGSDITILIGLSAGGQIGKPLPTTLPTPFVGSALVSVPNPAAVAVVTGMNDQNLALDGLGGYLASAVSPSGSWAELPGLRKATAGQESTGFALINSQGSAQTYTLSYWNADGSLVKEDSLTLQPNELSWVSQAADPLLPSGWSGSVQIVTANGGPVVTSAVQLYAGAAFPVPGNVNPPTTVMTPSPTNTPFGFISPTPTTSPASNNTATSTPTPAGGPPPLRRLYLPVVTNGSSAGAGAKSASTTSDNSGGIQIGPVRLPPISLNPFGG